MKSLCATIVLTALVIGCDSATPTASPNEVTFQGVQVIANAQTDLVLDGDRLVASAQSEDNARRRKRAALFVPGDVARGDMEFDPGFVPDGASVASTLVSDGEDIATFRSVKESGKTRLSVGFASSLGVTAVRVTYRRDGEAIYTIPSLPTQPPNARQTTTHVGTGDGDPTSVHVRRVGGRYIIVSDAGDAGGGERRGCPGFLLIPPSIYGREFPNGLCTDWVEVEPLNGDFPDGIDGYRVATEGIDGLLIHTLKAVPR